MNKFFCFLMSLILFGLAGVSHALTINWTVNTMGAFSGYSNHSVALVYSGIRVGDPREAPALGQTPAQLEASGQIVLGVSDFTGTLANGLSAGNNTVVIDVNAWSAYFPPDPVTEEEGGGDLGSVNVANYELWHGVGAVSSEAPGQQEGLGLIKTYYFYLLLFDASDPDNGEYVIIIPDGDPWRTIDYENGNLDVSFTITPEPATTLLLGVGLAVCALRRRVRG